jgi:RNase P subunit RPR2
MGEKDKSKSGSCSKCGSNDLKPIKTWTMKNPKTKSTVQVTQYLCRECGKKSRSAKTVKE